MKNTFYIFIANIFIFYSSAQAQNKFTNNYNSRTQINISGYGTLSTNYSKQYLKHRNINKAQTLVDGGLNFNIGYALFHDMTIGFNVLADTKYNKYYWQYDAGTMQELYSYIQNEYGRLEFGKLRDIAGKMNVSAPDVGLFGTNDSYIYNTLLIPHSTGGKKFFINSSTNISFLQKRERISIITSNKNKLRIGGTYTFGEKQHIPNNAGKLIQLQVNESISVATKLSTNFMGNNNISLSLGYSKYDNLFIKDFAIAQNRHELSSGINIFFKGITFGASVLKINETPFDNLIIANTFKYSYAGWAYNAGFAFEIGPWATSLSYHGSIAEGSLINPNNDKSHMTIFSMRRNLKKNLSFYTSFAGLILKNENKIKDNKGISITIGTIFKY